VTPLKLAVVGHTNTGKTSLLRTLTRNVDFGDVSARPATTRHVEGTSILLDGKPVLELYDTPGLEDSIALLEHLDKAAGGRRRDGLDLVREFLDSKPAKKRFAQEAKALRQVLDSDAVLYVVDARDRVLAKHRDELEILARCARPVVPVLNFTAHPDAKVNVWRDHLARVNMHVVAEFDTVVLDETSEQRLFEKMRTVLDVHAKVLDALIEERRRLREALLRASAELAGDLLLDAAALVIQVPVEDQQKVKDGIDTLRTRVRDREQKCVERLLRLHRFREGDYEGNDLPLTDGRWGLDLFSPEAVRQLGIRTGSAAAAGALVGLMVDAMSAGITLGAAAATGATVGGLLGAGREHGRRLLDRMRGISELRCDDGTIRVLAVRQLVLIHALLRRGHAAMTPVRAVQVSTDSSVIPRRLPESIRQARTRPGWSSLRDAGRPSAPDPARANALTALTRTLTEILHRPAGSPVEFP